MDGCDFDSRSVAGTDVPICFTLTKVCACGLCNSKSTDPNPLAPTEENDRYGGNRPWAKYRKIKSDADGIVYRAPQGSICLICKNVFRLKGMHLKHSEADYLKHCQKDRAGADEHQQFLASVATYIGKQKEHPGRVTLKDKQEICAAKTTLTTTNAEGVRFAKPKKQFVSLDKWDTTIDGPLDESKAVERVICGKKVRGIFKQIGRDGVFDVEEYDDKGFKEETVEHDGQGLGSRNLKPKGN